MGKAAGYPGSVPYSYDIFIKLDERSSENFLSTISTTLRLQCQCKMMFRRLFSSLTLLSVLFLLSSLTAANVPTLVNLRIEGATNTIFEGTVLTKGHNVTTPSGGLHQCDGTNNDANPSPGPTCTSALDDASKMNSFPFDGYVFL